jgi:purine-nucleoside phosphorylase
VGRFSRIVFGRDKLPERCIVFAGVYSPNRLRSALRLFDRHSRVKGMLVKYSFAEKNNKKFLLLFNVYGAAMMLDEFSLLIDGGVKSVFFIGSAGAKSLDIGTIVLPTSVIDRAGVVQIDTRGEDIIAPPEGATESLEETLTEMEFGFTRTKVVSVPGVAHGIDRVTNYVRSRRDAEAYEMELSTFYHFAKKFGLRAYALVYVSDNDKRTVGRAGREAQLVRENALPRMTRVAQAVLN